MRTNILLSALFFFLLQPALLPTARAVVWVEKRESIQTNDVSKADLERQLGRKLTFKEKIAWKLSNKILKKKRHAQGSSLETKAEAIFVLGLCALGGVIFSSLAAVLNIPYLGIIGLLALVAAIVGVVFWFDLSRNRELLPDRAFQRAQLGSIFSWVTIGLYALGLFFSFIYLIVFLVALG